VNVIAQTKAATYDALRRRFPHIAPPDLVVITAGVKALVKMGGPTAVMEVLDMSKLGQVIREYNSFDNGNDPYGEHDFGAFEFKGQKLFWKIDDYTSQPDPHRYVLTLMLAEEY
jgi:hypothetical protein